MMNLFEEPKVRHFTVFRFNGTYEPLPIVFARYRGLQVPQSTDLINYYGPPGSIPQVSAYKVLKDSAEINRERFRGKIVLIGSAVPAGAAFSVKDAFFVPGSAQSSVGVEIHSTVISNILKREWIRRIPPQYELPIVNGILVVAAFVLGRLTPRVAVLSAAAFVLVWILSAYLSFTRSLFLPGVNLCLIVLPLMMLATLLAKLNILRKKQEQLERMLGVDLED
jgi:CHASE2 domain-containing sensor protein